MQTILHIPPPALKFKVVLEAKQVGFRSSVAELFLVQRQHGDMWVSCRTELVECEECGVQREPAYSCSHTKAAGKVSCNPSNPTCLHTPALLSSCCFLINPTTGGLWSLPSPGDAWRCAAQTEGVELFTSSCSLGSRFTVTFTV